MRLRSPFLIAFTASLLVVFAAALLAGCTVGPDFERPDKPKAAGYTPETLAPQTASAAGDGGAAQTFLQGKDIPGQWWTSVPLDRAQCADRRSAQGQSRPRRGPGIIASGEGKPLCATGRPVSHPHRQRLGAATAVFGGHVRPAGPQRGVRRDLRLAQHLLCPRHLRRRAPPGRIPGGAGRVPALPARGHVSDPDLERGHRRGQRGVAARADRRDARASSGSRTTAQRRAQSVRSRRRLARGRAGAAGDAGPDAGHPAAAAEAAGAAAQPADDA